MAEHIESQEPLLDFVLRKLQAHKGDWKTIAKDSDVPYDTLTKIASGGSPDPRISTVQKLANYFQQHAA